MLRSPSAGEGDMCFKMLSGDYWSNKFCFGEQFTGIV